MDTDALSAQQLDHRSQRLGEFPRSRREPKREDAELIDYFGYYKAEVFPDVDVDQYVMVSVLEVYLRDPFLWLEGSYNWE